MKKSRSTDFSCSELPQTRKDQYFFLLRNQYWNLLKIGFVAFLFFIPYIFIYVVKDILNLEFLNLLNAGSLEEGEYHTYFLINTVAANILAYLLLPVLIIGISGLNRLFRLLVEGEPIVFKEDFAFGVKQNYGRTLQGALLFGFILLLHQCLISYFQSPIIIAPSFLFIFLLIVPISFIYLVYSSYYDDRFITNLGNSIRLYAPRWWQILLLGGVAIIAFYGLESIPIYHLKAIISTLTIFLGFPLFGLSFHEVAISDFDVSINQYQFPERTGLGLYKAPSKARERDL